MVETSCSFLCRSVLAALPSPSRSTTPLPNNPSSEIGNHRRTGDPCPVVDPGWDSGNLVTTFAEVDLKGTFGTLVLRVKPDLRVLLPVSGGNEKPITHIVVMQVKNRLIIPVTVGVGRLGNGRPCVFDDDLELPYRPPVRSANETLYRIPVVSLMRGHHRRGEGQGCDEESRPAGGQLHDILKNVPCLPVMPPVSHIGRTATRRRTQTRAADDA